MSSSASLISGLSSGIDWETIVDQLVEAEHTRVDLITEKQTATSNKLTAWQTFNTGLLALKTAAGELQTPDSFNLFTASMNTNSSTVNGADLVEVTVSETASIGSYALKVNSLATAQKLSSNAFIGVSDALGSSYEGDLLINGNTVSIEASDTLGSLRDKINDADAGVTASIINYATDDHRLILTSDTTGADGMVLENGGAGNILYELGFYDIDGGLSDVFGVTGDVANTSGDTVITADTLIKDIDGYAGYLDTDYIHLEGTDTAGNAVSDDSFILSDTTTVDNLLAKIETLFGDVTASITSDGKLKVVDNTSGTSSLVMGISVKDDGGASDGTLKFDTDGDMGSAASIRKRQIVAAADASFTMDGVTVTRSENTISDLVAGVTFDLLKADTGTTVTVGIDRDNDAIMTKIKNFVTSYNNVSSYIYKQSTYDPTEKKTGGVLFGDGTLRSVKSELTNILLQTISGVSSQYSTLGLVGISVDTKGQLSIDDDKLRGYLDTHFSDVQKLFAASGKTSTGVLEYVSYGSNTKQGEYTVHIDTLATRSTSAASDNTSLSGDETLTITEGSRVATISLTSGMTMAQIVAAVNSGLEDADIDVTASKDSGDHLILTHNSYGSAQSFIISQANNLLWTGGGDQTVNNGIDMAGTINGEAATGSGQVLTGNSDEENVDGLVVKYTGTTSGADVGTVTVTLGVAELYDRALFNITDSLEGYVSDKQESLQNSINTYQTQIDEMEERLALKREQLLNQYQKMELALQKIQSQSDWLTSQLTAASSGWYNSSD
jgi:flagellar capping protein FliD